MPGYAAIEVSEERLPQTTYPVWLVGSAAAFVGALCGFVLISTGHQNALYTTPATRSVTSTLQTTTNVPRAFVHAAVRSTADPVADNTQQFTTVPVESTSSNSLVFPLMLLSSAVTLAWGAVRMLSPNKVAMMTTTAVKREWGAQSGKKYKGVQPIIAPSLLAADLANLAADSKRVLEAGADVLHVDVMDGHFVPNLSWGAPVIKCLRQHTNAFFDTHLMVSNPEDFIAPMADAGVDQFTFHIEAAKDPKALIKAIKDAGMKVGISVKPKTPIDVVFPYVEDVDLILVMTVEPGFGGQSFMEDMMPKVKTLREKYPNLDIQVDGGLGPKTIDAAAKAGANAIVAGSACFIDDPKAPIDIMRASLEKYCTGPGL